MGELRRGAWFLARWKSAERPDRSSLCAVYRISNVMMLMDNI